MHRLGPDGGVPELGEACKFRLRRARNHHAGRVVGGIVTALLEAQGLAELGAGAEGAREGGGEAGGGRHCVCVRMCVWIGGGGRSGGWMRCDVVVMGVRG